MATTFTETVIPGIGALRTPTTVFTDEYLAEIDLAAHDRRDRRSAAMSMAIAKVRDAALRGVIETTKRRARAYIRRPVELNALAWNLSQAEPVEGLQVIERLLRDEPQTPSFPINAPLTNLAAARLGFRWARRAQRNGRLDELMFGQGAQ